MPMHQTRRTIIALMLLSLLSAAARAEDLLELSSGAKVRGKVTARTDKGVTIDVVIGSRTLSRVYPLDKIAAVTINGKREALGSAASSPTHGSLRWLVIRFGPARCDRRHAEQDRGRGPHQSDGQDAARLVRGHAAQLSAIARPLVAPTAAAAAGTTRRTSASTSGTSSIPTRTSGAKGCG